MKPVLIEQIDALLDLHRKGVLVPPVPGSAIDLLDRAAAALSASLQPAQGMPEGKTTSACEDAAQMAIVQTERLRMAVQRTKASDAIADLVARFSAALLEKLRAAEAKYGHDNAWMRIDWADDLRAQMSRHVQKGDPRDVAAYCAFAWHHGWSVAPATAPKGGE